VVRGAVFGALLVASLALTAAAVVAVAENWAVRYGPTHWSAGPYLYFGAGLASVLLGQLVGLWLWFRAPHNLTGLWLWLAGVSLGLWFLGLYIPREGASLLTLSIYVMRPALAMAVLGWPSGRPERRLTWWIAAVGILMVVVFGTGNLFNAAVVSTQWPHDVLSPFRVPSVSAIVGAVGAWLLLFAPAIVVVAILVRRRARLPVTARYLLTPIVVAGSLAAASDIVTPVLSNLAPRLLYDGDASTLLGTLNLTQNYAQVGIAAVGILVAVTLRRRTVTSGDRRSRLDVGRAMPVAEPSRALQEMLGDPSARVLYLRPDGEWLDAAGSLVPAVEAGRVRTDVAGRDGEVVATIDVDAARPPSPLLVEMAAATVVARLDNERLTALARSRQVELVSLQHALLDRTDAARGRIERDLHDGAQQRLVGLALTARLAGRTSMPPDSASIELLHAELAATRRELAEIVEGTSPAVLEGGLASALATLSATVPCPCTVRVHGDLAGSDPVARELWLIANEATANALKHAAPTSIKLQLLVDANAASVSVVDDGCGGVTTLPVGLAARITAAGGQGAIVSPAGGGTRLTAQLPRGDGARR
jgi:signal transduction histidine kinase